MFDINETSELKEEEFRGTKIYTIDNFYKDPDKIVEFLSYLDTLVFKNNEMPSHNMVHFEDRRHQVMSHTVVKVYEYLRNICGLEEIGRDESKHFVLVNNARFYPGTFNNYHDNYWWPHIDSYKYAAIIYLNKDDTSCGTNLYENLNPQNEPPNYPEHYQPWRSKSNYKVVKHLQPKYNRMVLFEGCKFPHGMNICNDRYFGEEYRMTQVIFLGQEIQTHKS